MQFFKKIIALTCVIAISLSCLVVPASAVDVGGVGDFASGVADFGQWAIDSSLYAIRLVGRIFDKDLCPERPGGVNGTHSFVVNKTTKDGVLADWYVCEYCGFNSGYKADSQGVSSAYNDYVQTLPATGYGSTGKLYYSPTHKSMGVFFRRGYIYCEHGSGQSSPSGTAYFDCSSNTIHAYPASGSSSLEVNSATFYYKGIAPVDGTYLLLDTSICSGYDDVSSEQMPFSGKYTKTSAFYKAGATLEAVGDDTSLRDKFFASAVIKGLPPVYEITPAVPPSGDTYNINTRPTSITGGNYGIVGDNGQITKIEDNRTIVNEGSNTFYNPITGITTPIINWSYNYPDRTYDLTLDGGKTSSVTYGDENIIITETTVNESGDTITNNYTIYYIIEGSNPDTPVDPPTPCDHTWSETSTTPATCTMPGSKLLTCSKCSQTKTESLPALGHDWQVKQSVTTEYDDTGQLIKEGYTIYECSRCHEQYKTPSGTSPPVNPSDPDASGDGVFSGIFGLLLDFLGFFFKTFKDFTKSGVKAFLQALQDGTSDIFGLLNPFDWSA